MDEITLSLHAFTAEGSIYDSHWAGDPCAAVESFSISGIYQSADNSGPIYVADAGQSWIGREANDYTLYRFTLSGRYIADFEAAVTPLLPTGVSLSIDDQGYEAATRPAMNMRETAVLIMAVCAGACLVVLWFYALLYVHRNGDAARTLLSLGTPPRGVYGYYLSGSGLLALLAALAGALTGRRLSGTVIDRVYANLAGQSVYDTRFSRNSGGEAVGLTLEDPALTPYLLTAAAVFAAALLLCTLFTRQVIRRQNPHYRLRRQSREMRRRERAGIRAARSLGPVDLLPGPSLRYSVRSILRGGRRSLAVPLVFLVMSAFICVYSAVQAGFQAELDAVYDTVPVTMQLTDNKGRTTTRLFIDFEQVEELEETGFIAESYTSVSTLRYAYNGVGIYADGTEGSPPEVDHETLIPEGEFARETFLDQLPYTTSPMTMTDTPANGPEFYLQGGTEITYGPGYGEADYLHDADSYLKDVYYDFVPNGYVTYDGSSVIQEGDWVPKAEPEASEDELFACGYYGILVSEWFFAEHALDYGDIISLIIYYPAHGANWGGFETYLRVIGTYAGGLGQDTIYLNSTYPAYNSGTWDSAAFLLTNTEQLGQFKDYLCQHYDTLGHSGVNRRWVIVDDVVLYRTVESLRRYISYMDLLYPVIVLLVWGIGLFVATLLLRSRRREMTTLRAMGAGRRTVLLSFFWEQLLLSLPGLAIGTAGACLAYTGGADIPAGQLGLLAASYYAGALAAILQTQRSAVLQLLTDKEG